MYKNSCGLFSESLDTRFEDLSQFSESAQIYAVWSDKRKDDKTVLDDFFCIAEHLKNEIAKTDKAQLCTGKDELEQKNGKTKIILAVEDMRLLCGDIKNVKRLYDTGVRVCGLVWGGESIIGGAHGTDTGLTRFGKEVVFECERLGMRVDVSHSSRKLFSDVAEIAKKPFIATHSNSAFIHDVPRNLTDAEFCEIRDRGGIVGMNLCTYFLGDEHADGKKCPNEHFEALAEHILHFLSLGGEKVVSLGCDRDGIAHEEGYTRLCDIKKLYAKLLEKGVSKDTADDIFYNNAERFFKKQLI